MPHSIEFPSITLDLHPTFSPAIVNNTMKSTASVSNQTTSMTLAIHPTLSSSANTRNNYTNSSLGACGPGIGSCPSGLCCRSEITHACTSQLATDQHDSGYGYCGSNSSYCGTNCMPNFGVCGHNASQPSYSFSYIPLTTSASSDDGTGAAGIITDDLSQPTSSIAMFSYAPESSASVMGSTLATTTEISFEPLSTTYTAVKSTWAATSYADASVTTVTVLKTIECRPGSQ